jgi:peptidase E
MGDGHIVAMGGGGFLMEPENLLLDDYVLSLSRRTPARVCFVPTAARPTRATSKRSSPSKTSSTSAAAAP